MFMRVVNLVNLQMPLFRGCRGETFFVASVSFCKIRLADSATTSGEMLTLLTFVNHDVNPPIFKIPNVYAGC